ncbi:MAG TPA: GNAT family N-acetyltransferase [Saprospiraceae bacterium]|nr:GNAT family N-acetyltransferase [Saprospiraceae bacterium]HNT22474.1 GNAT family N-acetyltransferase [Saprospiraceae bacterium]
MEKGIKLETERLILIPLTYDQVQKYLRNDLSLEMELGVETQPREISPALKEALEETFLPMLADPAKNYLYCTLWTIVLKSENRMVGDLCITGEPKDGEIEIGYGTYTAHQGRGYMVEAVGGLVNWALGQQEVKSVYASTEKTNLASRHILLKNRFKLIRENGDLYEFRIEAPI